MAHMMLHLAGGAHGDASSAGYGSSDPVQAERCISEEPLGLKCVPLGKRWTIRYNP
jgi:hypothetical protein